MTPGTIAEACDQRQIRGLTTRDRQAPEKTTNHL
jgi:hypothetical protein